MAFGSGFNYPPQGPAFQTPAYQQMNYMQPRQDFQQMNMQQPGTLPARYVTGREEAVAAQIIPGDPFIFADFAHGRMYVKQINAQTMVPEFVEFVRAQQPVQPQESPEQLVKEFATLEDLNALRGELESLRNSMAQQTKTIQRKVVLTSDD